MFLSDAYTREFTHLEEQLLLVSWHTVTPALPWLQGVPCAPSALCAPSLHPRLPCTNSQSQHMALSLLVPAFLCHKWATSFGDLKFVKPVAKLADFHWFLGPWQTCTSLHAKWQLMTVRICSILCPLQRSSYFKGRDLFVVLTSWFCGWIFAVFCSLNLTKQYREMWAASCYTHQSQVKQMGSNL